MESANEELKASNEEVMSMNEELQSANEELETSKEELQSLNEELSSVNSQLHDKVEEVESARSDMANLLDATHIATVFLDTGLKIKLFTPPARRMFNLIASDVGRPIGDLVTRFTDDDLISDARELLLDLTPREKEVHTEDSRWYSRRIMPYRTLDNRIDGVVITFVDITERKQAVDAVIRRLAAVVENSVDAIFSKDLDGTIRTWNRGAERLYGYSRDEAVGRTVEMLVPEEGISEWKSVMATLARGEPIEQLETERVRKDGQRRTVALSMSPIRDSDGKVTSVSVTGRDITERNKTQEALRESERFATFDAGRASAHIAILDEDGKILEVNQSWRAFAAANGPVRGNVAEGANYLRCLRIKRATLLGRRAGRRQGDPRRVNAEDCPTSRSSIRAMAPMRKRWFIVRVTPFPGDDPHRVVVAHEDITKRKELEREVVEVASQEQRRIGQDLHDTVGQELTALNILAGDLAETLRTIRRDGSKLAEQDGPGIAAQPARASGRHARAASGSR